MSFFIWETTDTLFDLNVAKVRSPLCCSFPIAHDSSQQISITNLTADPNQTLISGMSSNDPTFKYFAYSELCALAEAKTAAALAQRTAFFSDQKFTPTLWARFTRESLLLLGKDYQLFLRGGNPEPPAVAPVQPPPALNLGSVTSSSVPLLRKRIFKSTGEDALETTLDALASDGPIPRAVDATANAVDLPEIFRSAESKVVPQATKQEVQKAAENGKGFMETTKRRIREFASRAYKKYVPPVVTEYFEIGLGWWMNDRTNKIVEKSLPSRELDIVVIEGRSPWSDSCHSDGCCSKSIDLYN
jgi:nucleoporin NDC1